MINFSQVKGKTVCITGASRGIGLETAKLLVQMGANVVMGARDISSIVDEFGQSSNVLPLQVDVSDEDSVLNFVQTTINYYGNIDVLINAAGVGTFSSVLDSRTEDFDDMISINLRGTYLCCKHVAAYMVKREEGQILNLVSIAGATALPGCGGYAASKFGVLGLTRVLQAELRGKGLRITSVIPGAVNSSFWDNIEPKPDTSNMIPTESIAHHIILLICQPQGCNVDEISILPPLGIL